MLTDKNCSLIGPIYNLRICPKFKVKPQIFRNVAISVGNDILAIIMLMKIANTFSCLASEKIGSAAYKWLVCIQFDYYDEKIRLM